MKLLIIGLVFSAWLIHRHKVKDSLSQAKIIFYSLLPAAIVNLFIASAGTIALFTTTSTAPLAPGIANAYITYTGITAIALIILSYAIALLTARRASG